MPLNNNVIVICGYGSLSSIGAGPDEVWNNYRQGKTGIATKHLNGSLLPAGDLAATARQEVIDLLHAQVKYKRLDPSTLMAIIACKKAFRNAGWDNETEIAVNIGSSRGATTLFEKWHAEYLQSATKRVSLLTSPLTTLGNISAFAAAHLNLNGPVISHSVTCSTAMQSIANGLAWLRSGMAKKYLAGGSEAPLTDFTIAQMEALGLYSKKTNTNYYCTPLGTPDRNTLVLGEGAAVFALEAHPVKEIKNNKHFTIIEACGSGFDSPPSPTGISEEGAPLKAAMEMALKQMITPEKIDAIVMHAPGTSSGDRAELKAIEQIFGADLPNLISGKWATGHTFGASAGLSIELALLMIRHQEFVDFPYPTAIKNTAKAIKKVMINATGFGGNATSLIISSPDLF